MVKFAKNDRLDALIILARDELFLFSLGNDPKGGPLDDFLHFFVAPTLTILLVSHLFITFFPLTKIIQPHKIDISIFYFILIVYTAWHRFILHLPPPFQIVKNHLF